MAEDEKQIDAYKLDVKRKLSICESLGYSRLISAWPCTANVFAAREAWTIKKKN